MLSGESATNEALFAPAAARNGAVILGVLRDVLPRGGHVLEVASGSGEHAVRFATALPDLQWQPSDPDRRALGSIAAHARAAGLPNLLAAVELDARAQDWPMTQADAIVCINMIHIAPWAATEGLIAGAGRLLRDRSPLYLYGPFRIHGAHTAASNADFDEDLRARDPNWGVRDLEDVLAVAAEHGLRLADRISMPANNLSVVLRKAGA
ncbi:DUF938 domain-containing protein [Methylobacterium soli]|uniref:DUF938 domain-containing protein n=1 Tax=Methylobacterium soli TaxID=553447 RepID=A0A6L3SWV9_9HYPH|nr:DUF938 domain-containing protein [Methylobacterium soli]KAB1077452.1 DUF938 domain-containing protein [Methylobacterium soli]